MPSGNHWEEVATRLAAYAVEHQVNGSSAESAFGVAYDIDITLADLRQHIFSHLFQKVGLPGRNLQWALENYHLSYDVPEWVGYHSSEAFRAYQRSDFHGKLPVVPGAVEGVRLLEGLMPTACYATTRMRSVEGVTVDWLKRKGFPQSTMLMQEPDEGYGLGKLADGLKARKLDNHFFQPIESNGMRIAMVIDDNPEIINHLQPNSPLVVVLFGHNDLSRIRNPECLHIVACPTWTDVSRLVQRAEAIAHEFKAYGHDLEIKPPERQREFALTR